MNNNDSDLFGEYISSELQKLNNYQRLVAKHEFQNATFNVQKEMLFCDKGFNSGITQPGGIVTREPELDKLLNLLSVLNLPKVSNLDRILPQLHPFKRQNRPKVSILHRFLMQFPSTTSKNFLACIVFSWRFPILL